MRNEEHKKWQNVPFHTWEYEPQTEMKHKVLKYYLPIWAKILGKWNNGLKYIDGFGGIGAYHTKEDLKSKNYSSNNFGSPIFSMKTITELKENNTINYANAIIIDKEKSNLENIKIICANLNINLNVEYIEGDFDKIINNILDDLNGKQFPTFFLIDPFGFSIKLNTIKRIMTFDKTEVVINFMYNSIGRYLNHPNQNINKIYDELFGATDWRKYADKAGKEKELALVNLFRDQCKKFAKFVYPFKLNFPERNRPYYYLFHLTNHHLGCKLMKESFAKNNKGEFEYKGNKKQQLSIFDSLKKHETSAWSNLCSKCFIQKNEKNKSCEKCLNSLFDGQSITYKEFLEQVVDGLPFTEKEIKNMLNDFENKKVVKINSDRNRRTGIEEVDTISFIMQEGQI